MGGSQRMVTSIRLKYDCGKSRQDSLSRKDVAIHQVRLSPCRPGPTFVMKHNAVHAVWSGVYIYIFSAHGAFGIGSCRKCI